jgi:hypothetical protein
VKPEIRDDSQIRALTGVLTEKFSTLETAFALAIDDENAYSPLECKKKQQTSDNGNSCFAVTT